MLLLQHLNLARQALRPITWDEIVQRATELLKKEQDQELLKKEEPDVIPYTRLRKTGNEELDTLYSKYARTIYDHTILQRSLHRLRANHRYEEMSETKRELLRSTVSKSVAVIAQKAELRLKLTEIHGASSTVLKNIHRQIANQLPFGTDTLDMLTAQKLLQNEQVNNPKSVHSDKHIRYTTGH